MAEIKKQKDIKFLDDPVEAVRKLPDVYIGALGDRGFINMYREIIQNSLDEIIKGNTLDKNIIISHDARNHTTIVEDNGQGIDLKVLEKVFSVLHSSSNYDKKEGSGEYSSGKNGMGATITNYLSKFFNVESYRMDGSAAKVEFKEGRVSKPTYKIKNKSGKHGLITTFAPSDMVGEISVTDKDLYDLTWLIAHLCLKGTKIIFNSIDVMGQKHKSIIENKNGIYEILNLICESSMIQPIYINYDNGTMKLEALLSYDIKNMDDPLIKSFVNTCPTDNGTHVEGFMDGVTKFFRDYMNKIYLANNKKKLVVNAQDIKTGLRAVLSGFHVSPLFTGQSKEVFSQKNMKPFCYKTTLDGLNAWASANPNDLQKICKYIKQVCEIRYKTDNEKVKISDNYNPSSISGLPADYKKPNGTKDIEVFIVEGKSAGGGAENNRDKLKQGIFPIRGKFPNAFTKSKAEFFANAEVGGLLRVFFGANVSYKNKFDSKKFKPSKVIIMTDADPDGAHIRALLFSFFLVYLPFVIEEGKLFFVTPPLYGAEISKGKKKFFIDNKDFIEYVRDQFCKENEVCRLNGKKYTKKEISQIFYKNKNYIDVLDKTCANVYSLDPYFIEFILLNRNLPYGKFKKAIEKQYQYSKINKVNDTIAIECLVNEKIQTLFFNDRFINGCSEALEYLDNAESGYLVNGVRYSLYGLIKLFNSFEPKNLTRYKGLGEMNSKDLGMSTILPDGDRILKQYTINDVKKELKYFTELQSDKSAFIKGIKVRKEDIA